MNEPRKWQLWRAMLKIQALHVGTKRGPVGGAGFRKTITLLGSDLPSSKSRSTTYYNSTADPDAAASPMNS